MDDKHIPSPPIQTTNEYERNKELGILRIGRHVDDKRTAPGA